MSTRTNRSSKNFAYKNHQVHHRGHKKIARTVTIKNGKGFKRVVHYHKGTIKSNIKKSLKAAEIELIKLGKFIPKLFEDCGCGSKTKKSRKL